MSTQDYKLTVGLEVHAELNTRTKMFCDSKNDPNEKRPNVNVCPVCMGHPGTLPVINKEAIRSVLRLGVAVGGTLADFTEFDRKNYFYPDIPKGYQISQYKHPLVHGGTLAGVKITRVHLEEDTAKSLHNSQFTISNFQSSSNESISNENSKLKNENSLLDFNRAGVPLMELVTEPVIKTAAEAAAFAKELQLLLTTLGIAEANMEKGELRLEANISVARQDLASGKLGTKVEVKNLNSFKSVEKAIAFEYERQTSMLDRGEGVIQETRGWDDVKGETYPQRTKEDSHDYRYFPEPDLPKLFISEIPEFSESELKKSLPELPEEKRARFMRLGVTAEHAEIYVTQVEKGGVFEDVAQMLESTELVKLASNYLTAEVKGEINAAEFVEVVRMTAAGELSSKGAKEVIKILQTEKGSAREIAEKHNVMQNSNESELRKIVEEVVREEKKGVPVQFLVGQAMKKSGGRGNPVLLQKIFSEIV